MFLPKLGQLFQRERQRRSRHKMSARLRRRREFNKVLRLEHLEARMLLSVFPVTSLADSGAGTLREAITLANGNSGPDTIEFTVAGTINVLSQLPALSDTTGGTTIDGTSAPGYAGAPVVALRGPGEFSGVFGLKITSADNSVQALQIQEFVYGIYISGSAASENTVAGCYIGNDGNNAFLNWVGITIRSASNNLIGTNGDGVNDADERNVISGNATQGIQIDTEGSPDTPATGNVVAGNYIGTNAAGTGALPNQFGIWLQGSASNTQIGTDGSGNGHDLMERNIISGNARGGVRLESDNNIVAGNYIGTDVSGDNALPNGDNTTHYGAVYVVGNNNLIGTDSDGVADEAERNVISGNKSLLDRDDGIRVAGDGTVIAGNFIGTDPTGTMALPNRDGVVVNGTNTRIGTDGDGVRDEAERNIISGNVGYGVWATSSNLVIAGNYIGTDWTGSMPLGNSSMGVAVRATDGRIGTNGDGVGDDAERNIISGNGLDGIYVDNSSVIIAGNYIGTDVTGSAALGNQGKGVSIQTNVLGSVIGGSKTADGNIIAFNSDDGVGLWSTAGENNSIRFNSIHSNAGLGIDLYDDGVTPNDPGDTDAGPNSGQNFPVITAATFDGTNTTVSGTINSTASTTFVIDLYSNTIGDPSGHGEGETYLGTATCLTDAAGNGTWTLVVAGDVTGLVLSSTATDPAGNTSEFSAPQAINTPPVALDDSYVTNEDSTLAVAAPGILGNDTDADGDPLTAVLVASPSNGALTLGADGSFTYTPNAGFSGTDSLTYKANDGQLDSTVATVTITVNPVTVTPGEPWAWGYNNTGQLGDGTTTTRLTPVQVSGLSGITALASNFVYEWADEHHSVALKSDGTVWGWGWNGFGQLGDGSTTQSLSPVQVTGLTDAIAVSARGYHSLALKSDGTVWAWGHNGYGELGDGTTMHRYTPVQVTGLGEVTAVAAGDWFNLALKSDGTVWSWGRNDAGMLGDGTTTPRPTPGPVAGLTDVVAIKAAGGHSLALKSDGTVWAWGDNDTGKLGDGTTTRRYTPVQVKGPGGVGYLTGMVAIAVGRYHSFAVKWDGTVWAWGANANGQLGDGSTTWSYTPVQVAGLTDVKAIAGGREHSLALKSDGSLWVWGRNNQGQLGDGTTTNRLSPIQVSALSYPVSTIAAGTSSSLVVLVVPNRAPVAVGDTYVINEDQSLTVTAPGVLGNDTDPDGDSLTAVLVASPSNGALTLGADGSFTYTPNAGFSGTDSLTYKANDGQLDSTVATVTITVNPVTVPPGEPWAWGYNNTGQLGDGTTTTRLTPVQVSSLSGITALASNFIYEWADEHHSVALKSDGTVWGWGWNGFGQLGDGSTTQSLSPVQVTGLTDAIAVSARGYHSLALKSDGTVWAWGHNGYGELGDGTTTDRYTPVQVTGLGDITAIAAGDWFNLALRSDGTVWSWGRNDKGMLGDGTTTPRPTPGPVVGLTDVVAIKAAGGHSLALKSDGTVWAWGHNDTGKLGDGTTTDRYTPVQVKGPGGVGYLTGMVAIAVGRYHSFAVKWDGTVWAWGANANGQLGDGSTTWSYTPVQVTGLTDVKAIAGGRQHSLALKSDGSLWVWGRNNQGQLGDGTTTNRLSPIQVSGLTYPVSTIAAGTFSSLVVLLVPNRAPIVLDDSYVTNEDSTLAVAAPGILGNDTDADGDPLTAVLVGGPSNGTLTLNADGSFSYTPAADFNGSDSFTYKANDASNAESNVATVTITVNPVNDPPTAGDDTATVDQDSVDNVIDVLANDTIAPDVGETVTISAVTQGASGSVAITGLGSGLTYTPNLGFFGTDTFTYTVTDDGTTSGVADAKSDTAIVTVTVIPANTPPTADAGGPYSVAEGGSVVLTASGSDPEGDPLTFAWDLDNDASFETPGQSVTFSAVGLDGPSSQTIAVQATDSGGLSTTDQATVNVLNVAPTVAAISAPLDPKEVATEINASASFTDPGVLDTHTALWDWGDQTTSPGAVDETGGSGSVTGSHTYATPGVYRIKLTVTDDDGESAESVFQYVVLFDPSGGFVTGGGWINSPAGAYAFDPTLTGKANFGFNSKYKKGANVPTGQTQFRFKVADFNFHSTKYQWLVVAGPQAKFKGVGTINGNGEYGFMVTARDGQIDGGGGVDKFRIKIWDKATDGIVYDNQMGEPDDSEAATALGGGSIVIHKAPQALHAVDGVSVSMVAATLTQATLTPTVEEAISYWATEGVAGDALTGLGRIDVRVADLSGSLLGMASSTNLMWIDRDAAGYGWSTDPAVTVVSTISGMDLLSVVTHEFGHFLGLDHDDPYDVMAASLAPGVQRAVTSDFLGGSRFALAYGYTLSLETRPQTFGVQRLVRNDWLRQDAAEIRATQWADFATARAHDEALMALMAEWTSDRVYSDRVDNLRGNQSGTYFDDRLNGNFFLKAEGSDATVFDDDARDLLTGCEGLDWFFANLDIAVKDKLTDLSDDEFADDIDFILGD